MKISSDLFSLPERVGRAFPLRSLMITETNGDDYQNFYSCMLDDRCGYLQITSESYVSFGYEDAKGYHIAESQYIFPDGRYADIPVVVLVNSNCMSAGDGMAKFLGDCPNVTLMGSLSLTRIIPGKTKSRSMLQFR